MGLDRILSSPGRIRVLRVILSYGQINITRLAREASIHHQLASKYVEELVEEGIVVVRRIGRLRIIEVRHDNPKIALLRELLAEER
jgi:DNA-binding MarR family transcriptional regulator